jgi:short-subunit dehydrogenase
MIPLNSNMQARHVGKVIVSTAVAPSGQPPLASAGGGGSAGRVLVTGGTGYLGSLVAGWLAAQGAARHITLTSRAGRLLAGGALPLADASHPLFASAVTVMACDAAADADAAALAHALSHGPPLHVLLHAGGVLADAALTNQSAAAARRAAAPKTAALSVLRRRLLAASPASHALLFSSVAALLGSAGQANYAAANAGLDAAAVSLSTTGLPVCSVQWGAWAGAGMAAATTAKARALGSGALQPSEGLAALEAALGACAPAR